MKYFFKLIFFSLIGVFYRKVLQKVYYTDSENEKMKYKIVNLESIDIVSDTNCNIGYRRIGLSLSNQNFKTVINYYRIKFGKEIFNECLNPINFKFFKMYFFQDTHLGHPWEKAEITGFTHYNKFFNWIKKRTDYSSYIYISPEELKNKLNDKISKT